MSIRFISYKLKEINKWRWLLAVVYVAGSITIFHKVNIKSSMCLAEYIVYYLNDTIAIVYTLSFVLILVASEIYNGSNNTFGDYIYLKTGNRKNWLKCMAVYKKVLQPME